MARAIAVVGKEQVKLVERAVVVIAASLDIQLTIAEDLAWSQWVFVNSLFRNKPALSGLRQKVDTAVLDKLNAIIIPFPNMPSYL